LTGQVAAWLAESGLRNLPIEEQFDRAYETTIAQLRAGVA